MRNAFAAALVITVSAAAKLGAEPVLIQPGSYYAVSNLLAPDGTFETRGGFILQSLPPGFGVPIFGRELSNNARAGCDPCAPGDPWNLGASFELVGPSYLPGGPVFSIWGRGTLNFTTPDITVPLEVASPQTGLYAYAPFQMTGYIELFRHPGSVPLFAGDVIGFGRARASVHGTGDSRTFGKILEYQFTEPVPEPATLTLIVTGLAALGARARRRMRRSQVASATPLSIR